MALFRYLYKKIKHQLPLFPVLLLALFYVDKAPATMSNQHNGTWQIVKVRKGDTLSDLLVRSGVPINTVYTLLQLPESRKLTKIVPDTPLHIQWKNHQLSGIRYYFSPISYLAIERTENNRFLAKNVKLTPDTIHTEKQIIITDSLFLSGKRAGLDDRLIMELAGIFDSRIDFVYDIQPGDRFSLVYEERIINNKKVNGGSILAARFKSGERVIDAIRHVGPNGKATYYTPRGENLEQSFSRTPVDFTRISSGFTHKRMHPIFGSTKPHLAIDYAAPMNTPVKTTGDGIISFIGQQRGYGKVIYVRHRNAITTVYAHLNHFKPSLRKGNRVRKGDLIAYVGMTGYATGPHLHYEFRVNGVHKNPLTVKLPKGTPLPASQMKAFKSRSIPLLAKLGSIPGKTLVMETHDHISSPEI